jgi:Ca-activated chloride channel family protein
MRTRSPFARPVFTTLSVAMTVVLIAGCSDKFTPDTDSPYVPPPSVPQPGEIGATPGGSQDLRFARELVVNGNVPPPEAITVEGMFSEHDLPLTGDECTTTFCLRGALGWEQDEGFVQVGLSSTIDPSTFVRPSLGIVLLVDVSGSMGWGYGEYGRPAGVARALLEALVDRFDSDDQVAIATFASRARLVLDFVPGDQHALLRQAVESLTDGGSTYMEAGVALARDLFAESALEVEDRRLLILTDAHANVGATQPGSFMELAGELEQMDVGITMIGTGIGLSAHIMDAMINLHGGNGFSLASAELVDDFVEDSWPWMVCPIAYDLAMTVQPTGGFTVAQGYGFPGDQGELRVASVFLSNRRGALVLRLTGAPFEQLGAHLDLDYVDTAGDPHSETLSLALPAGATLDEHGRYFEQYATRKSTALALLTSGMREAAELYAEHREEAIEIMRSAAATYDADADALLLEGQGDHVEIERERTFAHRTLELMEEGASQGSLYGPGWPYP